MRRQRRSEAERRSARRAYYLEHREEILAERKRRYREDEGYRNRARQRYRERYHNDPEYHAKTLARARQRNRELRAAAKRRAQEEGAG